MGNKEKFYVIWKGKEIGIFNSRDECKVNVNGYPDAKYKSFSSLNEAEIALNDGWEKYYAIKSSKIEKNTINIKNIPFFSDSIAVDAACSGNPGKMEYRGIDLGTGEEIFHENFEIGTNNIGEFLAIANGLKYLKDNSDKVIYSDSKIAISRINQGKCKTQLNFEKNGEFYFSKLITAIEDAETWLKNNGINNKILKWNTDERGEIPADFGRK